MKKALLLVLALAVIPVGVDAQVTPSDSCAALSFESPLEDVIPCAEQGTALAQFNLGVMYAYGEGVPEDDTEAVRWYRLAAEQGDAPAQSNLGAMYANGEGVPEDMVLAYMWWHLAAAQGDEVGQNNKDRAEERMTREQIAEGQRLSTEWLEAHPPAGTSS
jgi:hypothetical protein